MVEVVVALMDPICARTAFNIIMSFMYALYEFYKTISQWRYTDTINGLKQSKRDLVKTQAEYDKFKKYKIRTAISK
jgi:hypothetical protein